VLWIVAPAVLVAALRPWTVRPIESAAPAAFDAGTFAGSAWPRVLREASDHATDVSELALHGGLPSSSARFIKGSGIVTAIDRRSRVGVMRVSVPSASSALVAIQIGPVIRGTAVRDASGFIRFSDFTNQFEFAGAANALNDHVLRIVVGATPVDTLVGRAVTFVGAIGKTPLREDGAIDVVPVQLAVVESTGQ
jgi:predicted lipoprotein